MLCPLISSMTPHLYFHNLQALLAADEIEKAFNLIEVSHLKEDQEQVLLKRVHQKAVFIHIANLNLHAAADSVQQSGLDLREVRFHFFHSVLANISKFNFYHFTIHYRSLVFSPIFYLPSHHLQEVFHQCMTLLISEV